jgi:hypothetical protein
MGIVTITLKSVITDDPMFAPKNAADLTSGSQFSSNDEPGQWICWDFREMRVRPTHYTIWAAWLKSWVVEGSLDGESWTEIDRQTNNQDFSFAVSNPAGCRFIRLTQTDGPHWKVRHGDDELDLRPVDFLLFYAVEFFGTLSE